MDASEIKIADYFDAEYYATSYEDLYAAFGTDAQSLYTHYMTYGLVEGRKAIPWLNISAYRSQYEDLDRAFGDDWDAYLEHYLTYGVYEARDNGTEFNARFYSDSYEDLKEAFGYNVPALYQHYVTYGKEEGRDQISLPEESSEEQLTSSQNKPGNVTDKDSTWDDDTDDDDAWEDDTGKDDTGKDDTGKDDTGKDDTDKDDTGKDDVTDDIVSTLTGYPVVSVTAIGDDGNIPENSCDGDYDTRWSYEGKGSWIIWDLGEVRNVGYMGIAFWKADERISAFDIEASVDGVTFFPVAENVSGKLSLDMMGVDFGGIDIRYIRFIGNGNTSNMWNSITEVGFYPVHESGEMVLPEREEEESAEVSAEILAAIDDLKAVYDEDILDFLANLYDPETGAFYYAVSSRDNKGFLPDLESTAQIIKTLDTFAEPGKTTADYMPAEYRDRLVSWTQKLQNKDDGYFYHPQWGKDITDSRRGRDLSWAITILSKFDASPLYPTALDRLTDTVAVSSTGNSSLPAYLQSETAFRDWINALPWSSNPYSAGNSVNAAAAQINAAGLSDVAAECLNDLQNQETGLWGTGKNYQTVSAAMKVAVVYVNAKQNINYIDKALGSIIEVALSNDAPNQITYIFNPWHAISSMRTVIEKSGDSQTLQWFTDTLYANAPEMIRMTKEKLLVFQKADGGFSYFTNKSSETSQGAPASLGLAEGDVNATTIALTGVLQGIYSGLGMKYTPVYDATDLEYFIEVLKTVKAPEKIEIEEESEFDFEDGMPDKVKATLTDGSAAIVEDPADGSNHVLEFVTKKGAGESVTIDLPDSESGEVVAVSFKLRLSGMANSKFTTMSLLTPSGGVAYELITYTENNKLKFGDRRWHSAPVNDMQYFKADAAQNTWYDFKVVYQAPAGGEDAKIKVYVDGVLVSESSRYYYKNGDVTSEAGTAIGGLKFSSMNATEGTVYIDDVVFEKGDEVSDDVQDSRELDFESGMPAMVKPSLAVFGGSVVIAEDPTDSSNHVLAFTTVSGSGETVAIDLPDSKEGESVTISFKLMMKEFGASQFTTISLGSGVGNTTYQMLTFQSGSTNLKFGDRRWHSNPQADIQYFKENNKQGQWYDFKIVYTPPAGDADVNIKVYIDGALVSDSNRFYYNSKDDAGKAAAYIGALEFTSLSSAQGTIYIDDITW